MPSWGDKFFFPLAFEDVGAGRGFETEHTQNDFAHVFEARQENGLWRVSLGGLRILAEYVDTWDAFHEAVKGAWLPFLFRANSRRFEIRRDQSGGIGTGDGVTTQFQLVKARSYDLGPSNRSVEVVKYPHHDYPEFRVPVGNPSGPNPGTLLYKAGQLVRVWVNGGELAHGSGFTVDRETGLITLATAPANGALIEAACKFWIPVHGQDLFLLSHGASNYTLSGGAELFQVPGE